MINNEWQSTWMINEATFISTSSRRTTNSLRTCFSQIYLVDILFLPQDVIHDDSNPENIGYIDKHYQCIKEAYVTTTSTFFYLFSKQHHEEYVTGFLSCMSCNRIKSHDSDSSTLYLYVFASKLSSSCFLAHDEHNVSCLWIWWNKRDHGLNITLIFPMPDVAACTFKWRVKILHLNH